MTHHHHPRMSFYLLLHSSINLWHKRVVCFLFNCLYCYKPLCKLTYARVFFGSAKILLVLLTALLSQHKFPKLNQNASKALKKSTIQSNHILLIRTSPVPAVVGHILLSIIVGQPWSSCILPTLRTSGSVSFLMAENFFLHWWVKTG